MSSWFLSMVSSDGMHQSSPADTCSFHFHKLTVHPFMLLKVLARGTGKNLPYNWASAGIQRGLASVHLIMQSSTLKLILPKWMYSESSSREIEEGRWEEMVKVLQYIACTSEILKRDCWRWQAYFSFILPPRKDASPLCKKSGRLSEVTEVIRTR